MDDRVIFKSWYSTLLSEFIKPYQCSLKLKEKRYKQEFPVTFPENFVNSIAFYDTEAPPKWYNQTHVQYYVNKRGDVVPDRTSHLAWLCNEHSSGKVIRRIQEIYSHIFIDELQDYAGWDLEVIPVSTTLPFIERQVKITSNQTRAKFYVACTRAKHSVVFAMENPCENGVFKATDIHFSDKSIPAYKFSKPDSDI